MYRSSYPISKMNCPSEENMIRMKLTELQSIKKLDFEHRNLTIYYAIEEIESHLVSLNFGTKLYN